MENDKQIKDTYLEQVKNVFLSDDLLAKNIKPEVYSLPDEFAKSKRNRNLFVPALILLYIASIGFGVYFLTTIEENKSKRVEVDIAEFRQFNLMELLAEKKENEEKLVQLQQEMEELKVKTLNEIKKLSPKEQQKAMAALNEKMKALEESYIQQIKAKEAAIQELEKSINAEKQQIASSAQETETALKNYQNLNQMQQVEMERLRIEYEGKIAKLKADHQTEIERLKLENQALIDEITLRYNPKFTRGEIATAINSKLGSTADSTWNRYSKTFSNERIISEQDFNQLRRKIQFQKVIINNLLGIPFQNSVPTALNRLDQLSTSINGDYETIWANLVERLKERDNYLNSYEYALNYRSMTGDRESGYVIDPRNPNRLLIFIDHIYSIKKGDTAYIFKGDDIPVAKIELIPEGGRMTARIVEVLKSSKIEPFDKILLKLEVAQ